MNSFTYADLEGEDKQHFDDHLKSADFLDVEVYPASEVSILGMVAWQKPSLLECTVMTFNMADHHHSY